MALTLITLFIQRKFPLTSFTQSYQNGVPVKLIALKNKTIQYGVIQLNTFTVFIRV